MAAFELSHSADQDLEGIARYTIDYWGVEQAGKYLSEFDKHFESIAVGSAHTRAFFKHRKDIMYSKCQKHVVFHLERKEMRPLILAVFHERMELMSRLRSRLDDLV